MSIERIEENKELFAVIVRNNYSPEETKFISDTLNPFQIGLHKRGKGYRYKAHVSLPFKKIENFIPNKIYYVKKGRLGIDIYNKENKKIRYIELNAGDLINFISGGHGVDVLEENTEFIEIKQGPYRGTKEDKIFLE